MSVGMNRFEAVRSRRKVHDYDCLKFNPPYRDMIPKKIDNEAGRKTDNCIFRFSSLKIFWKWGLFLFMTPTSKAFFEVFSALLFLKAFCQLNTSFSSLLERFKHCTNKNDVILQHTSTVGISFAKHQTDHSISIIFVVIIVLRSDVEAYILKKIDELERTWLFLPSEASKRMHVWGRGPGLESLANLNKFVNWDRIIKLNKLRKSKG